MKFFKGREKEKIGYIYDELPAQFLNKVFFIWADNLGKEYSPSTWDFTSNTDHWKAIKDKYIRKKGILRLGDSESEIENFHIYIHSASITSILDFIEFTFQYMEEIFADYMPSNEYIDDRGRKVGFISEMPNPIELVQQLNINFQEHNLGYYYINHTIIRRSEDFAHTEIIEPAMKLLISRKYEGASDEFTKAHLHFKEGRLKESIVESNKAFESTMKSICKDHNWSVANDATSSSLINILIDNGLLQKEQESLYNSFRNLLQSGVPTIRNKKAAHGQGDIVTEVSPNLAQFTLNLTASSIIFLIQCSDSTR